MKTFFGYIFQVVTTYWIITVILLLITVKFHLYYSHPAMCTDSQDSLTSWIYTCSARPCWSDLGPFDPTFHISGVLVLVYFVLLLPAYLNILIDVVKMYKHSPNLSGIDPIIRCAIIIVMCEALMCVLCIMIYLSLSSLLYSTDLRHTVHSQLKDSLPRYNDDGFLLREAWDNTMTAGCCGADGYQDFINLNMSIPSVCQAEVSTSYAKEVSVASNKPFRSGCVEAVMLHIIEYEKRRVFALIRSMSWLCL